MLPGYWGDAFPWAEVGTSAPESAPPLRAEHQFRSGMQRAEHAKKNGAE